MNRETAIKVGIVPISILVIVFSIFFLFAVITVSVASFQMMLIFMYCFLWFLFAWGCVFAIAMLMIALLRWFIMPAMSINQVLPAMSAISSDDRDDGDALEMIISSSDCQDLFIESVESDESDLTNDIPQRVLALRERGLSKKQIITEVWGVRPGGGARYKQVSEEYEQIIQ